MIWVMCNEDALNDFRAIDWSKTDISGLEKEDLQKAAEKYFKECGVSEDECDQLRSTLSSEMR